MISSANDLAKKLDSYADAQTGIACRGRFIIASNLADALYAINGSADEIVAGLFEDCLVQTDLCAECALRTNDDQVYLSALSLKAELLTQWGNGHGTEWSNQACQIFDEIVTKARPQQYPDLWISAITNRYVARTERVGDLTAAETETAIKELTTALRWAQRSELKSHEASTLLALSKAYQMRQQGRHPWNLSKATEYSDRSLTLYEELQDERGIIRATLSLVHLDIAEPRKAFGLALERLSSLQPLLIEEEFGDLSVSVRTVRAELLLERAHRDDLDEAHTIFSELIEFWESRGHRLRWSEAKVSLANVMRLQDDLRHPHHQEEMLEHFQDALEHLDSSRFPMERADCLVSLGNALQLRTSGQRTDNIQRSIDSYEEAVDLLGDEQPSRRLVQVHLYLGMALHEPSFDKRDRKSERALAHLRFAQRLSRQVGTKALRALIAMTLGNVLAVRFSTERHRDRREARTLLRAALRQYLELGEGEDAARAAVNLSGLLSEIGTPSALREAVALAEPLIVRFQREGDHELLGSVRLHLAIASTRKSSIRDLAAAISYASDAREDFQHTSDRYGLIMVEMQSAQIAWEQRAWARVLEHVREAHRIAEIEIGSSVHLAEAQALTELLVGGRSLAAFAHAREGRLREAVEVFLRYSAIQIGFLKRRREFVSSLEAPDLQRYKELQYTLESTSASYEASRQLGGAAQVGSVIAARQALTNFLNDRRRFADHQGADTDQGGHVLTGEKHTLALISFADSVLAIGHDGQSWRSWALPKSSRWEPVRLSSQATSVRELNSVAIDEAETAWQSMGRAGVSLLRWLFSSNEPLDIIVDRRFSGFSAGLTMNEGVVLSEKRVVTQRLGIGAGASKVHRGEIIDEDSFTIIPSAADDLAGTSMEADFIALHAAHHGYTADKLRRDEVSDLKGHLTTNRWHFCCHGSYREGAPLDAGLELDRETRLTVDDLLHMPDAVRPYTVFLSACDLGQFDSVYTPQEVIGPVTGFLQLGAGAVIASRWPADDLAAFLLAIFFYQEEIRPDATPERSLALAKKRLRTFRTKDFSTLIKLSGSHPINVQVKGVYQRLTLAYRSSDYPFKDPFYWAGWDCYV